MTFHRRASFFFLIYFLFTFPVKAQQGFWTWMHGGGPIAGNYGTQGVAAPTNEPPSMYKTDACWTDSQGKFWFYGGDLNSSALWKYDPVTNQWTWMKGPSTYGVAAVYGTKGVPAPTNNPPVVSTGSACTWIDAQDNLWLWGGTITTLGTSADMWKYDPITNMWTWMHGPGAVASIGSYGAQGVSSPTNFPPARFETSATWVDNAGNFWMFGGGVLGGQINDMWKYNPTTNEWTWMKGPQTPGNIAGNYGTKGVSAATNIPPCRWPYGTWTDNAGNFWMFGGTGVNNNTDAFNDMWKFDPLTNNWTWMSGTNLTNQFPPFPNKCSASTLNYPQSRYENTVTWKDKCGNLWMYSGQWTSAAGTNPNKNDIWCYKIQTNEWVYVNGNMVPSAGTKGVAAGSNFPGDTYGASAFSYNNEFWMFGGRTTGPNSNLLWRYIPDSTCAQSFCNVPPVNPVAHFTADTLIGCAPLTVSFSNASLNTNSWIWDFGDGSPTSNLQNPIHTYTNSGNYTVTLIASNGTTSDTLVYTNYVNVIPTVIVSFTTPNDTICVGQTITFTSASQNTIAYFWMIFDPITGGTVYKGDTTPTFSYTFNSLGVFSVVLLGNNQFGCFSYDSLNIYVVNSLSYTYSASICTGSSYTLPNGTVVTSAGSYIDTITTVIGCDSIITLNLSFVSSFTSIQNPMICAGNTFTLPGGTVISLQGTYVDTVTAIGGCDSIITTNLTITSPILFIQNPVICAGNNFTLPGGSIVNTAGAYVDTIITSAGCDSIITTNLTVTNAFTFTQNPVLCAGNSFALPGGNSVNIAGTYIDTINSLNGCDSIVTTNLTMNPNSSTSLSPVICSGNPYTLTDGTIVSTSGTYIDTVVSANGCDSIITINLTVNPSPVVNISPDVTIIQGQSTVFTASGGVTYNWFPSTGLDNTTSNTVTASPTETTTYCAEVTDSNGCMDTACVTVTVEKPCAKEENLGIPNAFSPNGDGINDDFCLQGWDDCIEIFSIKIYDRWGEKVYESSNSDFCWDGTYRGKPMDAQVFVYNIKAIFFHQKKLIVKNGNISLIR